MPEIRRTVRRSLTAEERDRHRTIREQVDREKPLIQARGRAALLAHDRLQSVLQSLKAAREQRGMTLAETSRRCGIDRSRLHRLENDADVNPTLDTLNRFADAVGVDLRITLVARDAGASNKPG